jgi:hypothetical protein
MAVNVESATASMNPNPKSGVDWRSAVQFLPLLKAELVGSQIGSVVEKVVRVASSCWHSDFLQLGCVIWQPSGVASRRSLATPVGSGTGAQDAVVREDMDRACGVVADAGPR